jgi:hypothetical protein
MTVKKRTRSTSVILLLLIVAFQALGGLYGGVTLVLDPSGDLLGLPISVLDNAPFNDFLVPGLILLIVLGVFPLIVTVALWTKPNWNTMAWLERIFGEHWAWVGAGVVGVGLAIWLLVELWWVGYSALLLVYGLVAALILILTLLPSTRRYYRL